MKIAIIGLGEAGTIYGSALADFGHDVTGFDPVITKVPQGIRLSSSGAEAAADADAVLVLTGARGAAAVAEEVLPALPDHAVYADLTSASPSLKRDLGGRAGAVRFTDVAILGAVVAKRESTPLMASGKGAEAFAELLSPIGAPVEVVPGGPGAAMEHKLVRSVFMKGLASVVIEAVQAGRAAGLEPWIREQIARQLAGDGQATIDRFLSGTVKHATRRSQEMRDVAAFLETLGVPHEMTEASALSMEEILRRGERAEGAGS
ncbi:DUF1932 domain-containing protein [Citricoccus sp. NPDC055426]|uniref:NAD(P)-dependent oxidoreductase n=1 Tax=Citricoccus sp. NPDC055426 TaxID=3155536 RepID=UPI00342FEA26